MNRHKTFGNYRKVNTKQLLTSFCMLLLTMSMLIGCSRSEEKDKATFEKEQLETELKGLGRIDSLQRRLEQYREEHNRSAMMLCYRFLGAAYRDSSRFDQALTVHQKEYELASEQADTLEAIVALNQIGADNRRIGALEEASSAHYQALNLCDQYSDHTSVKVQKSRVVSLNGIGNVHLTLDNVEAAENAFRLALDGEKKLGSDLGQAINYANLGSLLESQQKIDSARWYYKRSMQLNQKAGSRLGVALCWIHLGGLEEKAGQWDQAIAKYQHAEEILRSVGDQWHWMEAVISLIRANIDKGDLSTASHYMKEAEPVAEQLGAWEDLEALYHEKSKMSFKRGDSEQAFMNYNKSQAYRDSLISEKKIQHIQNIRIKYERESKEQQMLAMQRDIEQERLIKRVFLFSSLCIILLCAVIIVFLWYVIRIRSKNHKMQVQIQQAKDHFFMNITHEFRTPLTIILGFGRQMTDGTLTTKEELKKAGGMILRQGNGLLDLVNQLLDIAKQRSVVDQPLYRHGDAVTYIRMLAECHQILAQDKNVEFLFTAKQSTVMMDFIPSYLTKIVRNLLSNAIKFTPKHGEVRASVEEEKDKLKLVVRDNGQGIPSDDLPYIFDLFYQAQNPSADVGSGVGLALTNQLVEAMNGTIEVESKVGVGTTFTVSLPLKAARQGAVIKPIETYEPESPNYNQEPEESIEVPEESIEEPETTQKNAVSVLVVEDNADVARYIGMQIGHKYQLYFAHDGVEGLERALSLMPDLIVTDLLMPRKDGLEMCREIKMSEVLNHIPVIMITARSTDADRLEGLKAGADAYLVKPFSADELLVRIDNLLAVRRLMRSKLSAALRYGTDEAMNYSDVSQIFLNKFVDMVYTHMRSRTADVEQVASSLCMTPKQLRSKLFAITGEAPSTYIQRIRMKYAQQLLDGNADLSVADVALRCGFNDISYFSRIFKQTFSMTPTQYRRLPNDEKTSL